MPSFRFADVVKGKVKNMIILPLKSVTYTYYRDDQGGERNRSIVPPGKAFDPAKHWQDTETYRDMLISLLMRPSEAQVKSGGFDLAEVRKLNKIIDKFEAIDDDATSIDLEDAEYEIVKARVEGHHWGVALRQIQEFSDDIVLARERSKQRDAEEAIAKRLIEAQLARGDAVGVARSL